MQKTERKTGISRRDLMRYGAAGAGLLATGNKAAFAQSRELRMLFPGGSWKSFYEQTFTNRFTEETGTRFTWRPGHRFGAILIAQHKSPQWDLCHANQTDAMQLGTMGMLEEWSEERIPNLKDIHPSFRYPYLAGKCHTPFGLAVNTKRITRPIDSWLDLWDPEFAGKVAFPDWGWLGEETFHAINLVLGGHEQDVEPGMAKFKELYGAQKAVNAANVDQMIQLFVAEEIWIAPFFSARTKQARERGATVEFVIPKEGGMSWIYQTGVVANRPEEQQELAYQLVDLTLDPELQVEFAKLTSYPPTNIKAMSLLPDDREDLKFSADDLDALGSLQSRLDYMAMFGYRDEYRERWNKEVLSQ